MVHDLSHFQALDASNPGPRTSTPSASNPALPDNGASTVVEKHWRGWPDNPLFYNEMYGDATKLREKFKKSKQKERAKTLYEVIHKVGYDCNGAGKRLSHNQLVRGAHGEKLSIRLNVFRVGQSLIRPIKRYFAESLFDTGLPRAESA